MPGKLDGHTIGGAAIHDDDHDVPAYESSDDEEIFEVELNNREVFVAWKDSDQSIRRLDLLMDLRVSVPEKQAFFKLHSKLFCVGANRDGRIKFSIPSKVVEFIKHQHIYPSLFASKESRSFIPLRFKITQSQDFHIPDGLFRPKLSAMHLLGAMASLAEAQDFTIYFPMLNLVLEHRTQLESLPQIFSTFFKKGRHHTGGQVVKAFDLSPGSETPSTEPVKELLLPPYTKLESCTEPGPSRKRKRANEPRPPSSPPDSCESLMLVVEGLERLKRDIRQRFKHLENIVLESTTPYRYDSDEEDFIKNHVDNRVDDQLTGICVELEDRVMDNVQGLVVERIARTQEDLQEEIQEDLKEELKQELKEELRKELRKELREEAQRDAGNQKKEFYTGCYV